MDEIPEWVVDTVNGCIVPGHDAPSYAALSYFWPKDEPGVARIMLTKNQSRDVEDTWLTICKLRPSATSRQRGDQIRSRSGRKVSIG